MANIQSSKKRIRKTITKTAQNKMIRSALRTDIKNFETALSSGDLDQSKVLLNKAIKSIDMAESKGILHANTAGRKKSRLTKRLNKAL